MNNELERASTELTESHEKSHQLEQALRSDPRHHLGLEVAGHDGTSIKQTRCVLLRSATQATALHLEESLDELRREKVQCEERFLQARHVLSLLIPLPRHHDSELMRSLPRWRARACMHAPCVLLTALKRTYDNANSVGGDEGRNECSSVAE